MYELFAVEEFGIRLCSLIKKKCARKTRLRHREIILDGTERRLVSGHLPPVISAHRKLTLTNRSLKAWRRLGTPNIRKKDRVQKGGSIS